VPRVGRVVAVNSKAPSGILQGALDGAARTRNSDNTVRRGDPRRTLPRGGARTHGTGRSSGSGFGLGSGLPAPDMAQWRKASSSSLTAAGPPRNHTGFPLSHGSWGRKPGTSAYVVEQLRSWCSPLPGRTRAGEQGSGNFRHLGRGVKRQFVRLGAEGAGGMAETGFIGALHPPRTLNARPSTLNGCVVSRPPGSRRRLTAAPFRAGRRGLRVLGWCFLAWAAPRRQHFRNSHTRVGGLPDVRRPLPGAPSAHVHRTAVDHPGSRPRGTHDAHQRLEGILRLRFPGHFGALHAARWVSPASRPAHAGGHQGRIRPGGTRRLCAQEPAHDR